MPVEEIDAVKMGNDFTNFLDAAETTSGFWKLNADAVAWVVIVILFLIAILFIFLLLYTLFKKLSGFFG